MWLGEAGSVDRSLASPIFRTIEGGTMRAFRAYFNRKREAPQVWSIDEGTQDSEVNVTRFICHAGCKVESRYNGAQPNDDSPSAWIAIQADDMRVRNGVAHFITNPNEGRP